MTTTGVVRMSTDGTDRRSVKPELAAAEPTEPGRSSDREPSLVMDSVVSEPLRAVMQAHQDAVAARAQYLANQEQLVSLGKALEYAQKKYESGVMDFFSLREFINNNTRAELDLVRAQYDFVLKQKVLDLYEGKQLKF